jgi:hypothetical protein
MNLDEIVGEIIEGRAADALILQFASMFTSRLKMKVAHYRYSPSELLSANA